jgi:hypothetical protein
MSSFRKLLTLSLFALGLSLLGAAGGSLFHSAAFASDFDAAGIPCPHDECEDSDECVDNPGNNTYCEFTAEVCKTKGCVSSSDKDAAQIPDDAGQ